MSRSPSTPSCVASSTSTTPTDPAVKLSAQDPGARYQRLQLLLAAAVPAPLRHALHRLHRHDDVTPSARRAAPPTVPASTSRSSRICPSSTSASKAPARTPPPLRSLEGAVQLLREHPAPGLHQQGLHHGRLDRPRGQGRPGLAHLAPLRQRVGAGRVPLQERRPRTSFPAAQPRTSSRSRSSSAYTRTSSWTHGLQLERWKAPVPLVNGNNSLAVIGGPLYYPNAQHDTAIAAQITWYPKLHNVAALNGK